MVQVQCTILWNSWGICLCPPPPPPPPPMMLYICYSKSAMMTRLTSHGMDMVFTSLALCEVTGGFPSQKGRDIELLMFSLLLDKVGEQTVQLPVIWGTMWIHCKWNPNSPQNLKCLNAILLAILTFSTRTSAPLQVNLLKFMLIEISIWSYRKIVYAMACITWPSWQFQYEDAIVAV